MQNVSDFAESVCEMELSAREDLLSQNHEKLVDEIYRTYGILKECKLLEEEEMICLLSKLRFGDALGFVEILDYKKFDNLYNEGASANLKEDFSEIKKENIARSEYISSRIKELVRKVL